VPALDGLCESEEPDLARGLARGLELRQDDDLDTLLIQALPRAHDVGLAAMLEVLARRGRPIEPGIADFARHPNASVARAAAMLMWACPDRRPSRCSHPAGSERGSDSMSGYQSTELILATLEGPALPVIAAVRGYLAHVHASNEEACYVIDDPAGSAGPTECWEQLEPTNEHMAEAIEVGCGVRLDLEICVGRSRHPAMLCVMPVGGGQISATLKLASSVIDAIYAYDRSMEDFDDEAKRGLVELCIGFTRAAGAQGFLLQRDGKRLTPLTAQEIAAELQVRVRNWEIGGVCQSFMSLQALCRSQGSKDRKYLYASVTGLTIYDLVHPVKY
jgi:hypothetical protein